jgi:hypothetical protein
MRLIQFVAEDGRAVAAIADGTAPRVVRTPRVCAILRWKRTALGRSLAETVEAHGLGDAVDYDRLAAEKRLLVPLDHPEPSRVVLALTGLTHLGGAQTRDSMHVKLQGADLTDSMKMFKMGLEGGKPAAGAVGVQPEWAWKGDGTWIVHQSSRSSFPATRKTAARRAKSPASMSSATMARCCASASPSPTSIPTT